LTPSRKNAAILLAALAAAVAAAFSNHAQPQGQTPQPAQQPAAAAMNHNLIVLDPAHGGPDAGATLADHVLEKDITLALAARLRAALATAGFTVIATRDTEPADPLTSDQRAETANRAHALACIVLHATGTGSGVHLYTSTLTPSDIAADHDSPSTFVPIPWDMAQEASVSQSLRLAADLSTALNTVNLPAHAGQAPLRPLDNLMCPAVAVELAPLIAADASVTPVTDTGYQQRVISTLTTALQSWRDHAAATQPALRPTQ
jgi:N-acetylmuramoyl-L-alanine amidase